MQEQAQARRPFYIATSSGYFNSENVVSLSPAKDGRETNLRTNGGTEYSHTGTVAVPFNKVAAFFQARGYDFVEPGDIENFDSHPGSGPQPR